MNDQQAHKEAMSVSDSFYLASANDEVAFEEALKAYYNARLEASARQDVTRYELWELMVMKDAGGQDWVSYTDHVARNMEFKKAVWDFVYGEKHGSVSAEDLAEFLEKQP